jgi:hypothetical protein
MGTKAWGGLRFKGSEFRVGSRKEMVQDQNMGDFSSATQGLSLLTSSPTNLAHGDFSMATFADREVF